MARFRAGSCPFTLLRHGVHTCAKDCWDAALARSNEGAIIHIDIDALTPATLASFEAMYDSYDGAVAVSLARQGGSGSDPLLLMPWMFVQPSGAAVKAALAHTLNTKSKAKATAKERRTNRQKGATAWIAAGHSAADVAQALRAVEDSSWPARITDGGAAELALPCLCDAFAAALSNELPLRGISGAPHVSAANQSAIAPPMEGT